MISAPAGLAAPLFFIACIVFVLMDRARSDAAIVRADPAAALRLRGHAVRASVSFARGCGCCCNALSQLL
jgi:hypothetical protein